MPTGEDGPTTTGEKRGSLSTYLYIVQFIIAAALIGVILLQTQESSLGSAFGGRSSLHRSRRGVEKTLFQITIGLSVAFLVMALVTVIWAS
jgi:preprotein translocase subunit SecG